MPRYDDHRDSRNHGKTHSRAPYDKYNQEEEAPRGRNNRTGRYENSNRGNRRYPEEQHYASTDVSQSGDESADLSDEPLDKGKFKPKPKCRSQTPPKDGREGVRPLHYAELDLPPRKDGSESSSDVGRRRNYIPVDYAEIRV